MFENLEILVKMQEQKDRFVEIKKRVLTPLLTDLSYIEKLYTISGELKGMTKTERRQVFIFVILLFYSPEKIIGGKTNQSVMAEFCRVTECTISLISHNSQNLLFYCNHYDNFRKAVQRLINDMCVMLMADGMEGAAIFEYLDKFSVVSGE